MTSATAKIQITAGAAGNHGMSLISNGKLLQLYFAMVRYRRLAERLQTFAEQGLCSGCNGASPGMEASTIGVTIDLRPDDRVYSAHCGLIAGCIKGEPLDKLLIQILSGEGDLGHSAQDLNPLARATEAALAGKAKLNDNISVIFLDAIAVSSSKSLDAFRVAGAQQLPLLYVCQNSLSAGHESLPALRETEEIARMAGDFGFPAFTVDGSDVVAIYRVATESIVHARKGNGPTLIECRPGLDSAQDPIRNMETYLSLKGLLSEELRMKAADSARELDAAVEATAWLMNSKP